MRISNALCPNFGGTYFKYFERKFRKKVKKILELFSELPPWVLVKR